MRCLLPVLKDVKDTICIWARDREIQFRCVYRCRILMSAINVLQLNHIQKQTGCEMNVKGAISKSGLASLVVKTEHTLSVVQSSAVICL